MEFWANDFATIPKLGFGTYMLRGKTALTAIQCALDTGFRHIDTASIYLNEAQVGQALRESSVPRIEVFLATKVWRDDLSAQNVKKSLHKSLTQLQTDYVDLLLIHWPNDSIPLNETLTAFQKLKDEGKIRHIGLSNFPRALLKKAEQMGADFVTNQVEYHPLLSQKTVLDFINNSHNKFLTAYSPLARGKVSKIRQISDIAKKYGKSNAQIALRWLVEQKNVIAIAKAENPAHIKENFNIFDFNLQPSDIKRLFSLTNNSQRLINPPFAPQWDKS